MKKNIIIGAVLGFLAVALGAFGAHALEDLLVKNDYQAVWETGQSRGRLHLERGNDGVLPAGQGARHAGGNPCHRRCGMRRDHRML